MKTQLLRDFVENETEDGYSIVKDFLQKYSYIEDNINIKSNNSVCCDLVQKYKDNFAIWNVVEVLSFGDFIKLYEMYYQKYNTVGSINNYLWSVKFLRNAAAHNNCLINTLKKPYSPSNSRFKINKKINTFVSKIPGIKAEVRKKKMANSIVHDFVVTLFVFNNIVSSQKVKKHTMEELKELMEGRFKRNKSYFEKNQLLISYFNFIKIIIDYFHAKCL